MGCRKSESSHQDTIGILLKELGGGEFVRWNPHRLIQWQGDYQGHETTFYVKKFVDGVRIGSVSHRLFRFHIEGDVKFENATPRGYWNPQTAMFVTEGLDIFEGFVFCQHRADRAYASMVGEPFVIACGFGPSSNGMWTCMGSVGGQNAPLFEAAKAGDLHRMGQLGVEASNSRPNRVYTKTPAGSWKAHMHTKRRAVNGEILGIYVNFDNNCVVL